MAKVNVNIGQDEITPVASSNNLTQMDAYSFGLDDPRTKLFNAQKSHIKYINRISPGNTNFPIYAFMFNRSFVSMKDSEVTFFDDVVVKMKEASEPLIYQYVETTKNENWLEVFPKFMEFLFFMNTLWVWYDSEDEKFYLLAKCKPEDEKDNRYYDLLTSKEVVLPTEEPIKCMWDGRDNAHFEVWFKACYSCISREMLMEKLWFTSCKRLKITANTGADINPIEREILNTDPYIAVVDANVMVEALESVDPAALDSSVKNHYMMWDRSMAELGRVMNINDKTGERKTTGEGYKDMFGILCRQQATLNQLTLFSKKLKKIKNVELEFKVLGVVEKTGDEMEAKAVDGMEAVNKQEAKVKPI